MSGGSGSRSAIFYFVTICRALFNGHFANIRTIIKDISDPGYFGPWTFQPVNPDPVFRHFVSNISTLRTRFNLFEPNFMTFMASL